MQQNFSDIEVRKTFLRNFKEVISPMSTGYGYDLDNLHFCLEVFETVRRHKFISCLLIKPFLFPVTSYDYASSSLLWHARTLLLYSGVYSSSSCSYTTPTSVLTSSSMQCVALHFDVVWSNCCVRYLKV